MQHNQQNFISHPRLRKHISNQFKHARKHVTNNQSSAKKKKKKKKKKKAVKKKTNKNKQANQAKQTRQSNSTMQKLNKVWYCHILEIILFAFVANRQSY